MFGWFKRKFAKKETSESISRQERDPWVKVEQTVYGTRYWKKDGTYMDIFDLIPSPGFSEAYLKRIENGEEQE